MDSQKRLSREGVQYVQGRKEIDRSVDEWDDTGGNLQTFH